MTRAKAPVSEKFQGCPFPRRAAGYRIFPETEGENEFVGRGK